jgi:hypothetical protein
MTTSAKRLKGFKQNLPTKICLECQRPFQYRKKWKDIWSEIAYCSQKCKKETKPKKN